MTRTSRLHFQNAAASRAFRRVTCDFFRPSSPQFVGPQNHNH